MFLWPAKRWVVLAFAAGTLGASAAAPEAEPRTTRDFFNLGANHLQQGKLREAESQLELVLLRQEAAWQEPALYNLGHVRFGQGNEELKKGPPGQASAARGRQAAAQAQQAIDLSNRALEQNNVQALVMAYVRGRGARRELKAAGEAVRKALQAHGATLQKWRRASGDFRGAAETNPRNQDARHNAAVVDEAIARLIDSLRELQEAQGAMAQKGEELKEKMKEMRGRIPEEDMPPGAPGDEEEEEEQPQGPPPGVEEAPSREGEEMELSPEQAGWLLESFRLDTDRRLPMGTQDSPPKDRNRRVW